MNGLQTFFFAIGLLTSPVIALLWFDWGGCCDRLAGSLRAHAAARRGAKAIYRAVKRLEDRGTVVRQRSLEIDPKKDLESESESESAPQSQPSQPSLNLTGALGVPYEFSYGLLTRMALNNKASAPMKEPVIFGLCNPVEYER